MERRPVHLVLTCEHGGNRVPPDLREMFCGTDAARHLNSHRGFDPGALTAARLLADRLRVPLYFSEASRLVVDLNRSLDSPQLFSKFTKALTPAERDAIIQSQYWPYRRRVADHVKARIACGAHALHISVHTFTSRFRGTVRRFDVGVLFDPDREPEAAFSQRLLEALEQRGFRARANEPYLGTDDGLTTALREQFAAGCYSGLELELNNRFARFSMARQRSWCDWIAEAVQQTLADGL